MDAKQIRIENLVISYFSQREDASVRPIQGGKYKVKLMSDIARADFGRGMEELILIFDSDEAYNNKEAELITSNHPLLDIIRNDLERREDQDPRVCQVYLPIQMVNPDGQIVVPGIKLWNLVDYEVLSDISYTPYYIFTYKVVYEMDGGSENIVKITIDGLNGNEVQDLLPKIKEDLFVSGKPDHNISSNNEISLSILKDKSKAIITQRITDDLGTIERNIGIQLEKESTRIIEYYTNEIKNLKENPVDGVAISDLEAARDRQLAEWKAKLGFKVKIEPLSILKFWLPLINYQLVVPTSRKKFTIDNITYFVDTNITNFYKCNRCGNTSNFNICTVGKHPMCADNCNEKIASCKVCHDDFCKIHGSNCSICKDPVCSLDSQKCSYGDHTEDVVFCPDCIIESFEGKTLCNKCVEVCDHCGRNFPHELMISCRICEERVCFNHEKTPDGFRCAECGKYSCRNHGSLTEEKEWACEDHQLISTCCSKSFKLSSLYTCCCDPSEHICKTHSTNCLECGKPICENHRYPLKDHPGSYVCENCRKTCSECGSNFSYITIDLRECKNCHTSLCKSHQNLCVVGKEILCAKHTKKSIKGEVLCDQHAGYCNQTGIGEGKPIYKTTDLVKCVVCNQPVCSEHRSTCEICKSQISCTSHTSKQPKCLSCGSWSCGHNGCSANSHVCKYCGIAYCRNCISSKGICKTCEALKILPNPTKWINYILKIKGSVTGDNGRILGSVLESPDRLKLWVASNKSYSVVVVRYSPHFLEFWKEAHQLRIVIASSSGRVINIRHEKTA